MTAPREPGEGGPAETPPSPHAALLTSTGPVAKMHRRQVHRDPWPDFDAFAPADFDRRHRRAAAAQWAERARMEHASVHQFTQLAHVLTEACVELEILGALARLITDEVRHAELEWRMATACYPEGLDEPGFFRWERPELPYPAPPGPGDGAAAKLEWAVDVIASTCCIGETVSRPLLEALATLTTHPVSEAVLRQILRDEHLHAAFGFETLATLWPRLDAAARRRLDARLARHLASFERGSASGFPLEELVGQELSIERPLDGPPNLGLMESRAYAMIFYSTVEQEVLPRLERAGMDARGAWARRPR